MQSRTTLRQVVNGDKDPQVDTAINVVVASIDHHQDNAHQKLVEDVVRGMLLRNVLHMDENCKCCGVKGHYAKYCRTKNPRNPKERYSRRDTWEVSPERQGENFEFEEDAIQIKFSRDSFHNDKRSSNIMFDEIEHTRALGDLLLSNRSGAKCTVRFKLDSGAGANLLPLNVYKKVIP